LSSAPRAERGGDTEATHSSWLGRLLRIVFRALLFAFLFGFTFGTWLRCTLERAAGPELPYLG
jgi:hypothetical protein